ncbi:MAG: hypothetical protein ACKVJ1_10085 [Verrucomicrobiia bacterium]|jgi:hypothetical protein|tara:strand:- start:326 stop:721 length:396 start_codon:yes stop_codon:yes gene_type:complete
MSVPSDDPQAFEFFLSTLETHQNLLHAETQAIAAKHLDTIESILVKKEESLATLLQAKDNIGFDPRTKQEANDLIDRVIELQKRNGDSLKKLVDHQTANQQTGETTLPKPIDSRLKKAYSKSMFEPKSRLD